VLGFLADRHRIRTLEDIRKRGSLLALEGSARYKDDVEAIRKLEAHSSLSWISDDLEFNATLIRKG
jgi:hypothetical protein